MSYWLPADMCSQLGLYKSILYLVCILKRQNFISVLGSSPELVQHLHAMAEAVVSKTAKLDQSEMGDQLSLAKEIINTHKELQASLTR